jgi:hypothetical protein
MNKILIYRIIISILLSCLFLQSCLYKYQDMDVPDIERKLVVNSFIRPGHPIRVSVSASESRNNNKPLMPIYNATVLIYENNMLIEQLQHKKQGSSPDSILQNFYFGKTLHPVEGKIYRIEVSAPGFNKVYAESTIPIKTFLAITDTSWVKAEWDQLLRVDLKMEHKSEIQYYFLATKHIFPIYAQTGQLYNPIVGFSESYFRHRINDPAIGTRECRVEEDLLIFTNEFIATDPYPFYIEIDKQQTTNETICVDLITLSYEAYTYLKTLTDFKNNDPRYSEPVKLFSNVIGGHGIFAGINIASDTITLQN